MRSYYHHTVVALWTGEEYKKNKILSALAVNTVTSG